MNGPHDLGGQMGFGPVAPEKDEPYFHAEWEKRALGLTLSCGAFGAWSIDDDRRVVVSRHFSGSDGAITELRSLHGRPLRAPAPGFPPLAVEFIRWHREPRLGGVFRAPALGIA